MLSLWLTEGEWRQVLWCKAFLLHFCHYVVCIGQCVVCSVPCVERSIQLALWSLQFALCSLDLKITDFSKQCAVCSLHIAVYSLQHAVCSQQCAAYIVWGLGIKLYKNPRNNLLSTRKHLFGWQEIQLAVQGNTLRSHSAIENIQGLLTEPNYSAMLQVAWLHCLLLPALHCSEPW